MVDYQIIKVKKYLIHKNQNLNYYFQIKNIQNKMNKKISYFFE